MIIRMHVRKTDGSRGIMHAEFAGDMEDLLQLLNTEHFVCLFFGPTQTDEAGVHTISSGRLKIIARTEVLLVEPFEPHRVRTVLTPENEASLSAGGH